MKAYESHGPNGEIRFDYSHNGKDYTALLEQIGGGLLYSKFDSEGVTLFRSLEKAHGSAPSSAFLKEIVSIEINGEVETVGAEYSPVRIKRSCPACGSASLERNKTLSGPGNGGAPAVPRYRCAACGQECYHVGDEYLAGIVKDNAALFSDEERKELEKDPEGFMKELKEYTSRIFATKNVKRII